MNTKDLEYGIDPSGGLSLSVAMELDAKFIISAQETLKELIQLKESLRWKTFEEELPEYERRILVTWETEESGPAMILGRRLLGLNPGKWSVSAGGFTSIVCREVDHEGKRWMYAPPGPATDCDLTQPKGVDSHEPSKRLLDTLEALRKEMQ